MGFNIIAPNGNLESWNGTYRRAVRVGGALSAGAARQRQHVEPAGAERDSSRGRARLQWRGLPARFGNWHTIYTRMNRWSKNGVLDRVFEQLQRQVWRGEAAVDDIKPDGWRHS